MKHLTLVLIAAGLLSACASEPPTKTQTAAQVEDRRAPSPAPSTVPVPDTRGITSAQQGVNPLTDPNNILSKRSVFFDYDSFEVKPEYKAMIEAHAKYLVDNVKAKVFLQGHADERGSREYNLALGQKRSESVRKMLSVLGVKDEQLESVSFGEEKPRAECPEESCWSQNRRADIAYQGE